jgi:hypothetical protein
MSWLPRVGERTRERVSREFDNLGPDACVAEVLDELRRGNPELLDMASRCAADLGDPARLMGGFAMFYRLLVAEARLLRFESLPRVSAETRERVARQIDEQGAEAFTHEAVAGLERTNPELLRMAHVFSSQQKNYLATMQGFALLYTSLLAQAAADRTTLH